MQDSQNLKDLQIQLHRFISRLEELEKENKYQKEQISNQHCQLMQNVKIIDTKYQQMHRKYLKCLYKYGISQSCLTSMIQLYNKLIDKNGIDLQKMDLKTCIDKYGVVYEKDKVINEEEMKNIIAERMIKDSEEIFTLFFPNKVYRNDQENDSLTCTFQSLQSQRYKMQSSINNNSELITDYSDETIINNLTTQRYLEKLSFDYQNDQTLHYPKTFKVDKLLQQTNRDINITTDRSQRTKQNNNSLCRQEQKIDQIKTSLNTSINEDRVKRFENQENDNQPRRRSRAERLKQQY